MAGLDLWFAWLKGDVDLGLWYWVELGVLMLGLFVGCGLVQWWLVLGHESKVIVKDWDFVAENCCRGFPVHDLQQERVHVILRFAA